MRQSVVAELKKRYRQLGARRRRVQRLPTEVHPEDVFLVSYPRSGNTWVRRLVANAKDPDRTWSYKNIDVSIPDMYVVGRELNRYPRPRIIKSHESYQREYGRVIYIYRDGRDVAISLHNYMQTVQSYSGSFSRFLREYLSGDVPYGSWQTHVASWMFREHEIPFLSVRYEDLYSHTAVVLREILQFLSLDVGDDVIEAAIKKSSFERHQRDVKRFNPAYATGYRGGVKGGPGKWLEVFTQSQLELFWQEAGEVASRLGYKRGQPSRQGP